MTPAELTALLDRVIAESENDDIDFKAPRNQYSVNMTSEYVPAISNDTSPHRLSSGWLIFGVKNRQQVAGARHLPKPQSRESLKHQVRHSLGQGLTIREIYEAEYQGELVVLAEITSDDIAAWDNATFLARAWLSSSGGITRAALRHDLPIINAGTRPQPHWVLDNGGGK